MQRHEIIQCLKALEVRLNIDLKVYLNSVMLPGTAYSLKTECVFDGASWCRIEYANQTLTGLVHVGLFDWLDESNPAHAQYMGYLEMDEVTPSFVYDIARGCLFHEAAHFLHTRNKEVVELLAAEIAAETGLPFDGIRKAVHHMHNCLEDARIEWMRPADGLNSHRPLFNMFRVPMYMDYSEQIPSALTELGYAALQIAEFGVYPLAPVSDGCKKALDALINAGLIKSFVAEPDTAASNEKFAAIMREPEFHAYFVSLLADAWNDAQAQAVMQESSDECRGDFDAPQPQTKSMASDADQGESSDDSADSSSASDSEEDESDSGNSASEDADADADNGCSKKSSQSKQQSSTSDDGGHTAADDNPFAEDAAKQESDSDSGNNDTSVESDEADTDEEDTSCGGDAEETADGESGSDSASTELTEDEDTDDADANSESDSVDDSADNDEDEASDSDNTGSDSDSADNEGQSDVDPDSESDKEDEDDGDSDTASNEEEDDESDSDTSADDAGGEEDDTDSDEADDEEKSDADSDETVEGDASNEEEDDESDSDTSADDAGGEEDDTDSDSDADSDKMDEDDGETDSDEDEATTESDTNASDSADEADSEDVPDVIKAALDKVLEDIAAHDGSVNWKPEDQRQNRGFSSKQPVAVKRGPGGTGVDDPKYISERRIPEYLPQRLKNKATLLSKAFQTLTNFIDEDERNLRRGRLDGRRLVATQTGSECVFRRSVEEPNLSTVFEILWDGSGSMSGINQAESGAACAVIEEAIRGIFPLRIVNFNYDWISDIPRHFVVKDFDEQSKDNKSYAFANQHCAGGNNRDHIAIRHAHEDLMARPESRKFLIVLSDGAPTGGDEGMEVLADKVREEVRRLKADGIGVIAIYFGSKPGDVNHECYVANYKSMYGSQSVIACPPEMITAHLSRLVSAIAGV